MSDIHDNAASKLNANSVQNASFNTNLGTINHFCFLILLGNLSNNLPMLEQDKLLGRIDWSKCVLTPCL